MIDHVASAMLLNVAHAKHKQHALLRRVIVVTRLLQSHIDIGSCPWRKHVIMLQQTYNASLAWLHGDNRDSSRQQHMQKWLTELASAIIVGESNVDLSLPSLVLCYCRSEDDGFPGVDYNDVYKIKDTFAQDMPGDLPEAEVASLGSISIADTDLELEGFDVASEGSVF